MLFNPRNAVEQRISQFMRFIHPYLAFITYRFHVEKAREIGIRVEDFYMHKFHKEPWFQHHVYAQNFHPETLLERVRDVSFYRRPRTLFKGFKVPDWATADKMNKWEVDAYSRQAWDNAMHDFFSESTPMQFFGERQEPNVVEWFRLEQFGKGMSSRLFYNEVPQPLWHRHGGHLENADETLYSFTHGNQDQPLTFGIDTSTEEGRRAFKAEYDAIAAMTPEIIKSEAMLYPHEMPKQLSTEAHFQRIWSFYRTHSLRSRIEAAVASGDVSQADADAANRFLCNKDRGTSRLAHVNNYVLAKTGARPDLANDEGFLAADRVLQAINLNLNLNNLTAESYESQFWNSFDVQFGLTEIGMREALPTMIGDPSNRLRAEAIMEERTQQLSA